MLLHLGSDELYSFDGKTIYTIGRDIDRLLPEYLHELVVQKNYKNLYILNGPGSFTNTRIGCLAINTLCFLDPSITIYHTNKIDFYTRLYQAGQLSRYLFLYIGQRKKFWRYDLQYGSYVLCDASSGDEMQAFVAEKALSSSDWMVDNLIGPMYASCIQVANQVIPPTLLYNNLSCFEQTNELLEAYYGVVLSFNEAVCK